MYRNKTNLSSFFNKFINSFNNSDLLSILLNFLHMSLNNFSPFWTLFKGLSGRLLPNPKYVFVQ